MLQPMAGLSVLNFNLPPGLTMKLNSGNENSAMSQLGSASPANGVLSKGFNKITVQNVLSENNSNALNIAQANPNAIVRKIKDFGMIGTVNSAGANALNINSRKRPLGDSENVQPSAPVAKVKKTLASGTKKPKLSKEERTALRLAKKAAKESAALNLGETLMPTKLPGTPGRKGLPLPQAVARRNARERNRVKQVNNGFAALRERIPEEVAEAFETHSTCKNNCKKLSKVETLRMAVEYIRSLERLLGFDFPIGGGDKAGHFNSSSGEESFSLIKDEFDAFSPGMDENFDDSLSHYDNEDYFAEQSSPSNSNSTLPLVDSLPNITTLNGLQYIRIPGTNTYQLLTPDIFVGTAASPPSSTVDEEHFNALIDSNCLSPTSMSSPSASAAASARNTSISPLAHATATTTTIATEQSSSPPAIRAAGSSSAPAPVSSNAQEGSETLLSSSSSPVPHLQQSKAQAQQQQQQQQHHQMIAPLMPTSSSLASSTPSATSTRNKNNPTTTTATLQATAPAVNEGQRQLQGLRPTCAVNEPSPQQQQQLQQHQLQLQLQLQLQQQQLQAAAAHHFIKQEFEESTLVYAQQNQLYLPHGHANMTMSPPLDRQTPTTSHTPSSSNRLPPFFQAHQQAMYFDGGVVNLKKEFTDDLLDASHSGNDNMIESIDWWDAHTPKSEGGSVII